MFYSLTPKSNKSNIQLLPNEERQVTVWQIYSSKTREDSHESNTDDPNSTDQLRHGEET